MRYVAEFWAHDDRPEKERNQSGRRKLQVTVSADSDDPAELLEALSDKVSGMKKASRKKLRRIQVNAETEDADTADLESALNGDS